jgi:integrase
MRLTTKRVSRALKVRGRYPDGNGLYLQVSSPGTGSWLLRYQRAGKEHYLGLGPLHTVSLKQARERARAARLQLLDGVDPIKERKDAKAKRALEAAHAKTFAQVADQYFEAHGTRWESRKSREQFLASMRTYALPVLGALPIAAVDEAAVLAVLRPIWSSKTVTAGRVRNRIENVLDYAKAGKLRKGDNPARWSGNLEYLLAAPDRIHRRRHFPAVPFQRIGELVTRLRQVEGVAARALEFTVLTAVRTGETVGATWAEIDFDERVWTIPASRMKASRSHRVPLSDRAVELLRLLPREPGNPFIFIGPKHGTAISPMAMFRALKRLDPSVTVHGFRSSFRDWAAETTGYPNHVVEQALAHAIGSEVEKAYRRGDLFGKRIRLMRDWAKYIERPAVTGKVLPLRERVS